MKRLLWLFVGLSFLGSSGVVFADDDDRGGKGLNKKAKRELVQAGLNRYLGEFEPVETQDVGDGWTQHKYPDTLDVFLGDGPLCIVGTPYSVYTKVRNPKKLLIFMQGGGACWEGFYQCNPIAEWQAPPFPPVGIWSDTSPPGTGDLENPLADYSIVYLPYCDGSVFIGDNDVPDLNFVNGMRFHRGLQNASAGIDVAKALFPKARKILLAGSSAGGVGVAGFTPFLVRMAFGNQRQLSVFNDAGPVAVDLTDPLGGIPKRAADWNFEQYYPASCTDCSAFGQQTEIIKWRLDNDRTVRESFYSTDGDSTDRFFLGVPTQEQYRELIVTEHGSINDEHPDRYKRFIRSGDDSHTALQDPWLFYFGAANGVPLFEWVDDFLKPGKRAYRERDDDDDDDDEDDDDDRSKGPRKNAWIDIVEDFVPLPEPVLEE